MAYVGMMLCGFLDVVDMTVHGIFVFCFRRQPPLRLDILPRDKTA